MRALALALLLGCGETAPCERVTFAPVTETGDSEAVALHGCLERASGPIGAVILVHGLGGDRDEWQSFSRTLKDSGITSLRIDLRGHGESAGTFPTHDPGQFGIAANDVRGALRWLVTESVAKQTDIILVGVSLGGGAVIANAMEAPELRFVAWYPGLTYLSRGDSLVKTGSVRTEGLIIQGTADSHPRANPAWTRRFAALNPGIRVEWIAGGGHGAGSNRPAYETLTLQAITAWLGN